MRPVREICATIRGQALAADEVGYFRVNVPSMVYYLRRPVFEESETDAMVRRFKAGKRVFCIMTERDYDYLVGDRDLVLYVLDRRPRLVTSLSALLGGGRNMAERELLVVSNRPYAEAGGLHDHEIQ